MQGFQTEARKRMQQSNYEGCPQYHDKYNYFQKSIHFCHYYFILRGKTNEIVCFLSILLGLAYLLTHLFIVSFCHLKWEAAFCLGEVRSSQKALQIEPAASNSTARQQPHTTPGSLAGIHAQVNWSLPGGTLDSVP